MSSVAVALTQPNGTTVSGILVSDPQIGKTCSIYLGGDTNFYYISKVKGWMSLCGSQRVCIFDCNGKRFYLQVIATSEDFL
jgi:hypothetical protein